VNTPTVPQLRAQLAAVKANGLFAVLQNAAWTNGLPLPLVLGIGSRETNLVNELGDLIDGQYHGVGILQRDVQHADARAARDDGSWKTNPAAMVNADCAEIAQDLIAVRANFPLRSLTEQFQIVANAYNCGLRNAIAAALAGDPDSRSTGKNYGSDVMARMAVFTTLLNEQECPTS
jgi:hypothetical protein